METNDVQQRLTTHRITMKQIKKHSQIIGTMRNNKKKLRKEENTRRKIK